MRRILTILTAGLLLLGSLTSCLNINRDLSYTFGYNYALSIQDPEDAQTVTEYIESHFVNASDKPTYYGKMKDAQAQAIDYFQEAILKPEVSEFFYIHLKEQTDIVVLEAHITSQYGDCWIGTQSWSGSKNTPQ